MDLEKQNVTFKYLKMILILMVIDDHVGSQIGFLANIFPYNSFYMPLFVFASGYFYKKRLLKDFSKKIVMELLVPYIIWSLVGNMVALILDSLKITNWYVDINIVSIFDLFTYGTFSSITYAGWFAIMLFWVRILYNIIRRLLIVENKKIDYFLLIVLAIISILSVKQCMGGYAENIYRVCILRTLFYVLFYHMGYMFNKYWECDMKSISRVLLCSVCFMINIILICVFGDKIVFYVTKDMQSFNNYLLPYVTFITGSIFWYEICSFAADKVGDNKYVDFFSKNTFSIMMCHLFFTNIPYYYIMYKLVYNNMYLEDFDYETFWVNAAGVRYSKTTRLLGFVLAVIGSYIICKLIEVLKKTFYSVKNKKNNECEV